MNSAQIRYFVETMRCGSYSRAADRQFVTSRAVSKGVHSLEEEIGRILFDTKDGIATPTKFAFAYLEPAVAFLDALDRLEAFPGRYHDHPVACKAVIRLGVSTFYARGSYYSDDDIQKAANALVEPIRCDIMRSLNGNCLYALVSGSLDAAIVLGKHNLEGCSCTTLFTHGLLAAVSECHSLARKDAIELSSFDGKDVALPLDLAYFYPLLEGTLADRGIAPRYIDVGVEPEDHQRFLDGGGIVLVTKQATLHETLHGVCLREISAPDQIALPVCFIYRKDSQNAEQIELLLNQLVRMTPAFM